MDRFLIHDLIWKKKIGIQKKKLCGGKNLIEKIELAMMDMTKSHL